TVELHEGAASGNVVINCDLDDTAKDQCWVELLVSCGGCFVPVCPPSSPPTCPPSCEAACVTSRCSDVLERERTQLLPGRRDLTWNSIDTLGTTDFDTVQVGLIADDKLLGGRSCRFDSPVFRVNNNSAPEVIVLDPSTTADAT